MINPLWKYKKVAAFERSILRSGSMLKAVLPEIRKINLLYLKPDLVVGSSKLYKNKIVTALCKKRKCKFMLVDEGFISSVGKQEQGFTRSAYVVDEIGAYYSDEENGLEDILINRKFSEEEKKRAGKAIEKFVKHKLSRNNEGKSIKDYAGLTEGGQNNLTSAKVVLIDQQFKDVLIGNKNLDINNAKLAFEKMFEQAKLLADGGKIIIRTKNFRNSYAENIFVGKKIFNKFVKQKPKSFLEKYFFERDVVVVGDDVCLYEILEKAEDKNVFAYNDLEGIYALIAGAKVSCWKKSFYSGWGLTTDFYEGQNETKRDKNLSLEEIFYAGFIEYTRYYDPYRNKKIELEDFIDNILYIKKKYSERAKIYSCYGFTLWKRKSVKQFLKTPNNKIYFYYNFQKAFENAKIYGGELAIWASKETESITEKCKMYNQNLLRVEDGFIRSVGLGSNLVPASSLVFDEKGIYYNPERESKVEELLQKCKLSDKQLKRADDLRNKIVEGAITKYNFKQDKISFKIPKNRTVIFVPGQVEDDASVLSGKGKVKSNLKLLEITRKRNINAFIIYKPHPDVFNKNRVGGLQPEFVLKYADIIAENVSINELIDVCEEVYTISSFVGFEALIRKKKVHCFGTPFYSGWGLTEDDVSLARRTRELTLEDLVYCCLIEYPQYFDYEAGLPCEVETLTNKIIKYPSRLKKAENTTFVLQLLLKFAKIFKQAA